MLEEESQFGAPFPAGEHAVIRIERVELAGLQTALQTIFQEVRAALVEKHAAFLIDKRLEELQLCFGELDLGSNRSHCIFVKRTRSSAVLRCKPEKALPCGSDGFRDLLESFVLRAMQEFGDVQQNNETSLQFADTGDVSGFAFRKDTARGFDLRGRNLEHFRSRVYDEADQLVVELYDENAILLIVMNLGLAEPFAEIHHRNDV